MPSDFKKFYEDNHLLFQGADPKDVAVDLYKRSGSERLGTSFEDWAKAVNATDFVPPTPAPAAAPKPKAESTVLGTLGAGLDLIASSAVNTVASAAAALEGGNPHTKDNALDWIIGQARNYNKSLAEEYKDRSTLENTLGTAGQSVGYSLASIPAGIAGGVVGLATGGLPGAVAGGMAGGFGVGFRMSKNQILRDFREQTEAHLGRTMSKEEWTKAKEGFVSTADKYALWEAGTETIATTLTLGAAKFLPLNKIVGKTIAGKLAGDTMGKTVARGATRAAAAFGSELSQETVTEIGQDQTLEGTVVGPKKGEALQWDLSGMTEAAKRVGPQTFLMTALLGGGAHLGSHIRDRVRSQDAEWRDISNDLPSKADNKALPEGQKRLEPQTKLPEGGTIAGRDESSGPTIAGRDESSKFGPIPTTDGQAQTGVEGRNEKALPPGAEPAATPAIPLGPAQRSAATTSAQAEGREFSEDELAQTVTSREQTPEVTANNRGIVVGQARGKDFSDEELSQTSTDRAVTPEVRSGSWATTTEKSQGKEFSEEEKEQTALDESAVKKIREGIHSKPDEELAKDHEIVGSIVRATFEGRLDSVGDKELVRAHHVLALAVGSHRLAGKEFAEHRRDAGMALRTLKRELDIRREAKKDETVANLVTRRNNLQSSLENTWDEQTASKMQTQLKIIEADLETILGKKMEFVSTQDETGVHIVEGEMPSHLVPSSEISKEYGVPTNFLTRRRKAGELTGYRQENGQEYFYDPEELHQFMIESSDGSTVLATGTLADEKEFDDPTEISQRELDKDAAYEQELEGSQTRGGLTEEERMLRGDYGDFDINDSTPATEAERQEIAKTLKPEDIGDSFQHPDNRKLNPERGPYSWGRKPGKNTFEVSTKGDSLGSLFSALNAKIKSMGNRTIEAIYQTSIKGYKTIKEGKGNPPLTNISKGEIWRQYRNLWATYIGENLDLFDRLRQATKGKTLVDRFANTDTNQARALAEILNEYSQTTEGRRLFRKEAIDHDEKRERASVSNAVHGYMRQGNWDVERDSTGAPKFDKRGNLKWVKLDEEKGQKTAISFNEVADLYDQGYIDGSENGYVSGLGTKHQVAYTLAAKKGMMETGGKPNSENFSRKFEQGETSAETLAYNDLQRKLKNDQYNKLTGTTEAEREPVNPKTTEALADAHGKWNATKVNTGGVETGRDAGMKTAQDELNVPAVTEKGAQTPGRVMEQQQLTRENIRANPNTIYLFGDNLQGTGFGGQAAEARNEPNAVGIPTKRAPSMKEDAFFSDDHYDEAVAAIDAAFDKIPPGADVVIPSAGLGTGRAQLAQRAPRINQYLQKKIGDLIESRQTERKSAEAQVAAEPSAETEGRVAPIKWSLANKLVGDHDASQKSAGKNKQAAEEKARAELADIIRTGFRTIGGYAGKVKKKIKTGALQAMDFDPNLRIKALSLLRTINKKFGAKLPVDNVVIETGAEIGKIHANDLLYSVKRGQYFVVERMGKRDENGIPGFVKLRAVADKAGNVLKEGNLTKNDFPTIERTDGTVGIQIVPRPSQMFRDDMHNMYVDVLAQEYLQTEGKNDTSPMRAQIMKGADGKFYLAYFPNETATTPDIVPIEGEPQPMVTKVISGGQTGGDRIGLEAGKAAGIETGGTAPKGYKTQTGRDNSLRDFGLREHESSDYAPRTADNVKNSDGTVIFARSTESPGIRLTIAEAKQAGKPYLVNPSAAELRAWLVEHNVRTLNVAGNRAQTQSHPAGLTQEQQANARQVLDEALAPGEVATEDDMGALSLANDLSKRDQEAAEIEKGERETPTSRAEKLDEEGAEKRAKQAAKTKQEESLKRKRQEVDEFIKLNNPLVVKYEERAEYYAAQVEEAKADTELSSKKRKENVEILQELQQEQEKLARNLRKRIEQAKASLAEEESRQPENKDPEDDGLDADIERLKAEVSWRDERIKSLQEQLKAVDTDPEFSSLSKSTRDDYRQAIKEILEEYENAVVYPRKELLVLRREAQRRDLVQSSKREEAKNVNNTSKELAEKKRAEKHKARIEKDLDKKEALLERLKQKERHFDEQEEALEADISLDDITRNSRLRALAELKDENTQAITETENSLESLIDKLNEAEERLEKATEKLERAEAESSREVQKMFGSLEQAVLSEYADDEGGAKVRTGEVREGSEAGVEVAQGVDLSDTMTNGGKFKQKAVRSSVATTGRQEGSNKKITETNELDDRPRTFQGEGIEDGGQESADTISFVQLEDIEKEGRVISRSRSDWGIFVKVRGRDGSVQTYKVQGGQAELTRLGAEYVPGASKRKEVIPSKTSEPRPPSYDTGKMIEQLDMISFHLDGENLEPFLVDNAEALPEDIKNDESIDHKNAAAIIHKGAVYFVADRLPTETHFWNAVGQVGQNEYNANDAEVWGDRQKGKEELYGSYGWKGYDGKGKPRFRTKSKLPTKSSLTMDIAKRIVRNLKRILKFGAGVKVKMYSSFTSMPPHLQRAVHRMGKAHSAVGFVYGGEVHIIVDRHENARDLIQTALHEIIGHHGMREMLGAEYESFLDQTANRFKGAILQILSGEKLISPDAYIKEEDRTLFQRAMGERVDWDSIPQDQKRKAAEELLSTWFERTEQNKDGSFKNPLINNSINKIAAMLARAVRKLANRFGKDFELTHAEIKELAARAMAGVDLQSVSGFSFAAKEVFGANKEPQSLNEFATYWEQTRDRLFRLIGDEFRSVDLMQRAYEKTTGKKIPDFMDIHGKTGLKDSRVDNRVKEAKAKYLDPLIAEMKKQGVTSEELSDYLYAKFAPHRNKVINQVSMGTNKVGSGMSDQEAQDILDGFDADKTAKLEALAQKVYEVNQARLDVLLEYGLEKPKTVQRWKRSNGGRYVPLRADEDVTSDEGLAAMSVTGKSSKTAEGRTTRAQDPLAWSFYQLFNTYARGERNEIDKALYEFVKEVDNPDIAEIFDPETERALAKELGQPFSGEMPKGWDPEKLVGVRLNGRQVFININHRWVRREFLRSDRKEPSKFVRALGVYNRWIAMANVFFDPQFLISNGSRDFQTAMGNLNLRDSVGTVDAKTFSKKVAASTPRMAREIFRVESGKGSSAIYERYRGLGGKTGYSSFATIEQTIKHIQRDMKKSEKSLYGAALASFDKIESVFGVMNDTVENAVRLAAFKEGLDAGLTEHQAITLAKNLTVNFSRKGVLGAFLNSYKLFFNASLQGSIVISRLMKSNPVKAKKLVTNIAAAGFLISELNYLMAGDDDDGENLWKKTEAWKRKSYIVLSFPGNHQLMLPKSYGFGAFYDFGQMLSRMVHSDSVGGTAGELSWFADSVLQNFSPLQVGVPVEDSSSASQAFLQFVLPTAASIPLELRYNRDWKGDTIMHDAEGTAAFNGAQAAGHIMKTLGGGAGRFFAKDLPTNIAAIARGEYGNLPPYKRLTRKFYGNVPRYQLNKAYWAADRDLKKVQSAYQRKRAVIGNTFDRGVYKQRLQDFKEFRNEHLAELRFQGKAQAYKNRIKILRGKIEASKGDKKAALEDQMYKLQGQFLQEYHGLTD